MSTLRTFLTCVFANLAKRDLMFRDVREIDAAEARLVILNGVITGPEFIKSAPSEEGWYQAEYFSATLHDQLAFDEASAKAVVRPWEQGMEPGIGDRVLYMQIDRGTGAVIFRLMDVAASPPIIQPLSR